MHTQQNITRKCTTRRTRLTSAIITITTFAVALVVGCAYPGDITNIGEESEVSNASGQQIAQQPGNGTANGSGNEASRSNGNGNAANNGAGNDNDTVVGNDTVAGNANANDNNVPDIASASTPDNGAVTRIEDVASSNVVNNTADVGNPADVKGNMPEIINNIPETLIVDAGTTGIVDTAGTTTLADGNNNNEDSGNPFTFVPIADAAANNGKTDTAEIPLIALLDIFGQTNGQNNEVGQSDTVGQINIDDAGTTGTTTLADTSSSPIEDDSVADDSFFTFIPIADAFSWTGGKTDAGDKEIYIPLIYDWGDIYDSWNPQGPGSGNPPDTFTGGGQQNNDGKNSGSTSTNDTTTGTSTMNDASPTSDVPPTIGGPKTIVHELTLSDDPDYYWYNNITEKYQMKVHKSWALTEATDKKTVFGDTADNVNDKAISPATSKATITFVPWDKKMSFSKWVNTFPEGYEVDYKGKKVTMISAGDSECCLIEYANIPIKDYGMVQIEYGYTSTVVPADEESTAPLPPQEEVNWSFFKKAHDALYEMVLSTQKYNGS